MPKPVTRLSWHDVRTLLAVALEPHIQAHSSGLMGASIYGVPRGGVSVALIAAHTYNMVLVEHPKDAHIIVDDIIDSGKTRERYAQQFPDTQFVALVDNTTATAPSPWVVFPWERDSAGEAESAEDNVRRLLQIIGENPDREGLRETPKRFVKALKEFTAGLHIDPTAHLDKRFPLDDVATGLRYDQIILSGALPFVSLCEHHLLPFNGEAFIGYLPAAVGGGVVGLSKLARLLDGFARRPQVQERLTEQIALAIQEKLAPRGCAVILRAQHSCQCFRGVMKTGKMVTSSMHGLMRDDMNVRNEFLALCKFSEL